MLQTARAWQLQVHSGTLGMTDNQLTTDIIDVGYAHIASARQAWPDCRYGNKIMMQLAGVVMCCCSDLMTLPYTYLALCSSTLAFQKVMMIARCAPLYAGQSNRLSGS